MSEERNDGAFLSSLKRNNRDIRNERAQSIGEDAQITYSRRIQDMELSIRRLLRNQENMLDMSPTNAQSLIVAKDFDPDVFYNTDHQMGVKIRNLRIELAIAQERYKYLFGDVPLTEATKLETIESEDK